MSEKRAARVFALLAVGVAISLAAGADAMPNYARQPGVSCFSCHSQISSGPASPAARLDYDEVSGGKALYVAGFPGSKLKAGFSIHKDRADLSWAGFTSNNGLDSTESESAGGSGKSASGASVFSGLSGFISGDKFYAALGFIGRKTGIWNSSEAWQDSGLWYRLGYAPQLGPVNLDMGLFGDAADMKSLSPSRLSGIYNGFGNRSGAVGLDAAAQGEIGDVSLSLKAVYMNSGDPLLKDKLYYSDGSNGFGAAARIGIGRSFGVSAAYHTYTGKTGDSSYRQDAASIGADYNITGKITLKSQYTSYGLDKDALTGQDGGAFSILLISGF